MKQYWYKGSKGNRKGIFPYTNNYILILVIFTLTLTKCIRELSPREECFQRNRCDEIENDCYLRNALLYKLATGTSQPSPEDSSILVATCSGLRGQCRKNCESSTLF